MSLPQHKDDDASLKECLAALGYAKLRAGQVGVVADILEGKQVLAVLPTGGGKSLCYQLPALLFEKAGYGMTLVVSPLIALMKDQVDSLRERGISAAALTSASSPDEQHAMIEEMRAGHLTLLYVAPERFRSVRFLSAIQEETKLALIAIDEAHCISEWGHDFRPEYRRLGEVVRSLPAVRTAAFTATATPQVREDIVAQLGMSDARIHVRGFDRPNLHYAVLPCGGATDKSERLPDLIRTRTGGVALVYAATRKNAERYASALRKARVKTSLYHAGLEDEERTQSQDDFMNGDVEAIVATNAFGMGIDKSDIRLVIHADLPRSPEAYYQEAGRCGRDGLPGRCVLLFNHGDVRLQEFLINASYPSGEVLRGMWKLLREREELAAVAAKSEDALLEHLPKAESGAIIASALRILERHGLLQRQPGKLCAVHPDPRNHQRLDVDSLARRAEVERDKLRTMVSYAYAGSCRRQLILSYFGDADWKDASKRCSACDLCDAASTGKSAALSEVESEQAMTLLRLVRAADGRFGRTKLIAIVRGELDDQRFTDFSEYGSLTATSKAQLMSVFRALEATSLVVSSGGEYPTLCTTELARAVLRGKKPLPALQIFAPQHTGSTKNGGRSRFRRRSSKHP